MALNRFYKAKNFIIIFFVLLFCNKLFSQLKGEYKGLYTLENQYYPITEKNDTFIDGKKTTILAFKKVEWKGEKKLLLFKKGKFYFEYLGGCHAFSSKEQKRKCTGSYKINKDTVILTSTYTQSDFCSVTEKIIDTIATGYVMIVTNYPNDIRRLTTFINGFDLQINDTLIGEFKIHDTIYYKKTEVRKLFFSCCSPYQMEWSYVPQNVKSNFFEVTLKREIDNENVSIDNSKLLISNKKLIVLKGEKINVKDSFYIKN